MDFCKLCKFLSKDVQKSHQNVLKFYRIFENIKANRPKNAKTPKKFCLSRSRYVQHNIHVCLVRNTCRSGLYIRKKHAKQKTPFTNEK